MKFGKCGLMAIGAACVALGGGSQAAAAGGFGSKAGLIGAWTVYIDTNAMSDAKECTALYKDNSKIQFTLSSFAIGYDGRGGIQSYRLRLDDAPPRPLTLATNVEQQAGAVIIDGERYKAITGAHRVRVEALTALGTVLVDDLAIGDVTRVLSFFEAHRCAG